jgi:hypothetical protein
MFLPIQPLFKMQTSHLFGIGNTRSEIDECLHQAKRNDLIEGVDPEVFCEGKTRTALIHRGLQVVSPDHALCSNDKAGMYITCLQIAHDIKDPKQRQDALLSCDSDFWSHQKSCAKDDKERRLAQGPKTYQDCMAPSLEEWERCSKKALKEQSDKTFEDLRVCMDKKDLQVKECLKHSFLPKDIKSKLGVGASGCIDIVLKASDECLSKAATLTDDADVREVTKKCQSERSESLKGCKKGARRLQNVNMCRANANSAFLHCQYDAAALPAFNDDLKVKKGAAFEKCHDIFELSMQECDNINQDVRTKWVAVEKTTSGTNAQRTSVTKL